LESCCVSRYGDGPVSVDGAAFTSRITFIPRRKIIRAPQPDMRTMVRKLAVPALLLAITIGFNWKLLLPGQYTWLDGPDSAIQTLEWFQAQAVQWHSGHFPLWDPYLWAGQPFPGQVQPGTLNPLNWIVFSMPLQNGFVRIPVLHWYWVGIQFLSVFFAYLLCRDLRSSRTASVLGGCAFGLGGFVGGISWPQLMMSALPVPLILMFFLRVMRREKPLANAAASGALLGASFLSGHHNVPFFFTLAMCGLWITHLVWSGWRENAWRKSVAPLLAFSACFGLIAAAQILPAMELGKLSLRWAGPPLAWNQRVPYAVHDQFSLHPLQILGIVIHGFQGDSAIFVGLVALTLGIFGAIARWQESMAKVLTAISLGGLLFTLGSSSLFHGILYALAPGMDKARTPTMAEAIFQVGLIALAAYGVDSFRSSAGQPAHRIAIRLVSLLGVLLFAALLLLITVRPEQSEEYKDLAMAGLVSLLLAGILLFWSRSRISHFAAGLLLILLLLFELNLFSNYGYQPFEKAARLQRVYQDPDVAAYLKQVPQPVRVEPNENDVPYNFGDWYGISELGGFQPSLLKAVSDGLADRRFKMLLSANYYLGRESKEPDQRLVFEGQSGLKVFQNPAALPRVRIAHATIAIPHPNDVLGTSLDSRTNLERTVLLPESAPALENCDGGMAVLRDDTPARVVVRTESPCRAMLVVADVWYPGWKAYVDGNPAQLWKAYNVIRGVVVDAGQHQVVMVYEPTSVYLGAGLAALGIILCVFLQFTRRPKARWSHHPPPTPHHPISA
jgi:hypothetical protein